ncbi:hypothetical protein [Pseudohongiella sp.]|nr:hypothetical protein [Pseudohongiella sp.]
MAALAEKTVPTIQPLFIALCYSEALECIGGKTNLQAQVITQLS